MVRIIPTTNDEITKLKEKINSLEEEMIFLKEDLEAADDEVEELETRLRSLEQGNAHYYPRKEVIQKLYEAIQTAQHNIILTAPSIQDIGVLFLFEISANVNIKVACNIESGNSSDQEILDELQGFDNITFRLYDGNDRFCALIDGEKLLFGACGSKKDQILLVQTTDPNHIKIFNTLVMEAWLRGKKL
ncbi:MAG: hypothetical protein DRO88_06120 [Promethearchaeia archaeon]|nr:MAG: hypothetical protein DRO88_06120 [Candidatus Lokiarchaeia archaeon]